MEPVSPATDAFKLIQSRDYETGVKIILLNEILETKISFVAEMDSNYSRIVAEK